MPKVSTNLYVSEYDQKHKYLYLQKNKGEPKYLGKYMTPHFTKSKIFYSIEEGTDWLDKYGAQVTDPRIQPPPEDLHLLNIGPRTL